MAVVCWACCSYSYSEVIVTKTQNAAGAATNWLMTNILPAYTGLVVTGVNYQYTAVKDPKDAFVVTVQNQNALGSGYIFRSVDDWTGRPGNTITRTIPQPDIPTKFWGSGSITTSGVGELRDTQVFYSYKYDTCKQFLVIDSRCPNYIPLFNQQYKDPLDDENIQDVLNRRALLETEEERERNRRLMQGQQREKPAKVDRAAAIKHALLTAEAMEKLAAFEALNNIPNFGLYSRTIPGGVYPETIKYADKVLPDSRNAARLSGSQERLHNQLVELQYNLRSKND